MKKLLILAFIAFSALTAVAQNNGVTIKGHVLDGASEEHLPGVVVKLEGSGKAVTTDETGHFQIHGVVAGEHILSTQYVGYAVTHQQVKIEKKETSKSTTIYIYPETHRLNEVVVEGSFRDLNRQLSPIVVNQLTAKNFETSNSTTLAVGLNYMPGVRVENNCQNCGTQEIRINGLEGEYSQILMDGQPIFSSLTKVYGLEQLPLNMVKEVQVVRGGGSVLYGSNAIGGVMDILTKDPTKNSYEAKYTLSMIDGKSADNNVSLNTSFVDRSKTMGISVFGNMRERNPWDANKDGFSEIGKNKSKSIGFRSYAKPTLNDRFSVDYHHITDFRRGGDNIKRPPHEAMIAESTDYTINSGAAGYTKRFAGNKQSIKVNGAFQSISRDSYFGEGMDLDGYGKTKELGATGTVRYELNMDKFLFMPSKFIAGFTHSYTNLEDTVQNRYIKQILNVSSLYAQNEWRNDKMTLMMGVRVEKHNKVNNINVIPRMSARYRLNKAINARGSFSMGYRAPEVTASDLDVPVIGGKTTITYLDKDLKREYSNSLTGGFDFTFYNENYYAYLLVEGFYTKINRVFVEEEIGEDDEGNTIVIRRNGKAAQVYGVNIEGNVQPLSWLDIQMGMTFQKSRYTRAEAWSSEEGAELTKRMFRSPNRYGYMTATATPHKKYAISLSGVYTGPMRAAHFAGGEGIENDRIEKTKDFYDITCKLSYFINLNATNKLEINGGVQNIFDQRQKDYDKGPGRDADYIYGPTLPRTFFVGIKISSI